MNDIIKALSALKLTDAQKAAFIQRVLTDSGIAPVQSETMATAPGCYIVLGNDRYLPLSADQWAMVKTYLPCIHTS